MTTYFGGWYQRTTLHLSEIYEFLIKGTSKLNLDREKLTKFQSELGLEEVTRENGALEFVLAKTKIGITIRYYEDGLYVLETESEDIPEAKKKLEDYFEQYLNPALGYIFSLGAPTPKVLANIKTTHPIAVVDYTAKPETYKIDKEIFGEIYGQVNSDKLRVFKTPNYILLVSAKKDLALTGALVEMQIFFREFKDQLEKYLNIHRNVWEEISSIKERKTLKGSEVDIERAKLDSYQKTINLINSRINQMGAYINTRAKISREMGLDDDLVGLFQYKFETLTDTHNYIKEIWRMTVDYLNSAIQVIQEIRSQTTNNSIQSLQVITTYGVVGGILGYFARENLPKFTIYGVGYFLILVVVTFIINRMVSTAYKSRKYRLKFSEVVSI